MLEKLESIKRRFDEVAELIVMPDAMTDMKRYSAMAKEYKELDKIVTQYKKYKDLLGNIDTAKKVLETEKDPEFREMAKAELDELIPQKDEMESEITEMLIPKDPMDSKDIILEIRA